MGLYNKTIKLSEADYVGANITSYPYVYKVLSNGRILRLSKNSNTQDYNTFDLVYSDDKGKTWTTISNPFQMSPSNLNFSSLKYVDSKPIIREFENGLVIMISYISYNNKSYDSYLIFSNDYGNTWSNPKIFAYSDSECPKIMEIIKVNNNYLLFSRARDRNFKTKDFINFTEFSVDTENTNSTRYDFTQVSYINNIIVIGSEGSFWYSYDNGNTYNWTYSKYYPIPNYGYYSLSSDDNTKTIDLYINNLDNYNYRIYLDGVDPSEINIIYNNNYLFIYVQYPKRSDGIFYRFFSWKNGKIKSEYLLKDYIYATNAEEYMLTSVGNRVVLYYNGYYDGSFSSYYAIIDDSYDYVNYNVRLNIEPDLIYKYDNLNNLMLINGSAIYHTYYATITPEERTTIYANDYSTITGSQILENSVRSVNHDIMDIVVSEGDVGSISKNTTISQNPQYHYNLNSSTNIIFMSRYETYTQSITNCTITTNKPIIGEITKDNFKFSGINYKWEKSDYSGSQNQFHLDIFNAISATNENKDIACSITPQFLEDNYEVLRSETSGKIDGVFISMAPMQEFEYSVSNINKINDYKVTFDCKIATKYAAFSYQNDPAALSYTYIATAKIIEAKNITITLNCDTINSTNNEFVYSIDLNDEGQYIQNNPFARNSNELFSLSKEFFEEQAQVIIDTNKDGRMVLTVNTTTDLNLYNGKELTVTMKDGTLANNGATFEVVNIKEKFTGFNWKQVLTLKEKNN